MTKAIVEKNIFLKKGSEKLIIKAYELSRNYKVKNTSRRTTHHRKLSVDDLFALKKDNAW